MTDATGLHRLEQPGVVQPIRFSLRLGPQRAGRLVRDTLEQCCFGVRRGRVHCYHFGVGVLFFFGAEFTRVYANPYGFRPVARHRHW